MQASPGSLANRGGHAGGLQAIQGGLQALVVAQGGAPADEAQNLVRCGPHPAGSGNAGILCFHDLAGGPDQDVGIPDGGDTMLQRALDSHSDSARVEVDGHRAPRLGEREEGVGHQVLCIARRHVSRQRAKQIQLSPWCWLLLAGAHGKRLHWS
ncbi:hypothetical protein D3C81_1282190 [compost metagenome]